jgi:hypothetical protein
VGLEEQFCKVPHDAHRSHSVCQCGAVLSSASARQPEADADALFDDDDEEDGDDGVPYGAASRSAGEAHAFR